MKINVNREGKLKVSVMVSQTKQRLLCNVIAIFENIRKYVTVSTISC